MKKLLTIVLLLTLTAATYAQKDVTKFLGIPVDGTKSAMIQKLKAKGFTYNSAYDYLEGEFNGRDVTLFIATNNNMVWRIMVRDARISSETDIKIRFNELCRQFERNKKYISPDESQVLSEDEDISFEIMVHKKRYQASFFQQTDSVKTATDIQQYLLSKYTPEQLTNTTEEMRKDLMEYTMDLFSKKSVWFMISEDEYDKYRILLFYDNEYNHSNGEDL